MKAVAKKEYDKIVLPKTVLPFQPQTGEQLLARIDHSLAQIDVGKFRNAEDIENELLAEIGV